MVKNLSVKKIQVPSLVQDDPLGKEMAIYSSILAWEIPWTEEPGRQQSIGVQSWTRLEHAFRRFSGFRQVKHKDGQQTYHGKNAESQRQGEDRESSRRKMTYRLLIRKPHKIKS